MKQAIKIASFLIIASGMLSFLTGCAFVNHELDRYDGEVYLTPPPPDIPSDRLLPFRVSDSHIRILELIPLYSYRLDNCMAAVNPNKYPVYSLDCHETFEWWEVFILISQATLGFPDSRTVEIEGVIALPEEDKDWRYEPGAPLFGPTIFRMKE